MTDEQPSRTNEQRLREDWKSLLFGVRRSIRYHVCRRRFFDRFSFFTKAISIIFGSATVYTVLKPFGGSAPNQFPYAAIPAAVVTIVSALDLLFRTTESARTHDDLARRFTDLEKQMITTPFVERTLEKLSAFRAERLDIEKDEPPPLLVLDSICHNEQARAEGYAPTEFVEIRWLQRKMAQFVDIGQHKISRQVPKAGQPPVVGTPRQIP